MSQIHKSQVPNELLHSAIAWEQLRQSYWSQYGFEEIAADAAGRTDFYENRLNDLLSEQLS